MRHCLVPGLAVELVLFHVSAQQKAERLDEVWQGVLPVVLASSRSARVAVRLHCVIQCIYYSLSVFMTFLFSRK